VAFHALRSPAGAISPDMSSENGSFTVRLLCLVM
jgi:hypothetical protein